MPILASHVQTQSRRFAGEQECRHLLQWLNAGRQTKAHLKVFAILDLYKKLRRSWETKVVVEDGNVVKRSYARHSDLPRTLHELRRLLFEYKFYPMFFPVAPLSVTHWLPAKGGLRRTLHGWPTGYSDINAVFDLMQLSVMGLLDRLFQCSCGKWIFARFAHQKFCSARCREREFRSSAEWKAKRRQKAREYYWLHKSKNVK
jgi:hypothetical protein